MTLTFQEAAQILKISPATVKNWLKAGVLQSTSLFHIKEAKKNIATGKISRLQKGANKLHSRKVHGHAELLSQKENILALKPVIEKYGNQKKELLLAVYLNQLVHADLIKFINDRFITGPQMEKELAKWRISFRSAGFLTLFRSVQTSEADFTDNLLGYLHQSLNRTSAKQNLGAYYTPASAVKKSIQLINSEGLFCDPCCGSGNFLTEAYLQMKKLGLDSAEKSVFGFDCDPLAVLTARANLTLASNGKIDVVKAVQEKDFLAEKTAESFRYIATNPPWGAFSEKAVSETLRRQSGLERTKDSFSFFLIAALRNLQQCGSGSFILPLSFMNVSAHAEIRHYLFSKYTVHTIEILDEKFSGVMTGALLLSVQKMKPPRHHLVSISSNGVCRISNSQILNAKDAILPLNNDNESLKVLGEIESNAKNSLKGQSDWGLGLVTGNNKKFLFDRTAQGRVPVVTGSQIFRFRQPVPRYYCKNDLTKFQQTAPLELYHSRKKLVYRFICKELVFAIDRDRQFTLNSANILIPKSAAYSCELLCGLLNSRLAQYYFSKKFSSLKVLRSHLETFPLPDVAETLFIKIENCVSRLEKGFNPSVMSELDELVFEAYGLSNNSKDHIREFSVKGAFNG